MEDQVPSQTLVQSSTSDASQFSERLLPEQAAATLRKLSHDLSNALEIVVQTSYLLSTVGLKEPADDWLRMLEEGVSRTLEVNNSLRAYIKDRSRADAS